MIDEKSCAVCGRRIEWRKKWADCWTEVKYCSSACRKRKLGAADRALESEILRLLRQRNVGKTLCPSEVARSLFPEGDVWREQMENVRMAGRRLVANGQLEITQKGKVVDSSSAKGIIRFRLRR